MVNRILTMKKVVRRLKMIETLQMSDGDEIPAEVLHEVSEMRFELLTELDALLDKELTAAS